MSTDHSYFGTNLDAVIFSIQDGNQTTGTDGGFIMNTQSYSNGTLQETKELLRIRYGGGNNYGTFQWMGKDVIHSGNISSQSVNYATSAGSANSVAWGNVSGKPSTFTPSSHTHNYIEAKGNYTFNSSTLPNSFDYGISAGFVNSNSGFGSYGSVLTVRTFSGGGGTLQLYAPYSNTYGGSHLKARFGDYGTSSGNSWTSLKTIAWTDDIPSTISWSNVTGKDYPTFTSLIVQNDSCNNSNDALAYFRHYSSNDWTVKIDSGSYDYSLYVKGSSNACKIDGNLTCTNAYATSDRHLKKDIKNISTSSLERLFDISDKLLKQFTWKQTGKASYGLIAQELEQWIPEAVETSDVDGYKSVNYEVAYAKILAMVIYKLKTLIQ